MRYDGGCHCGAITLSFETALAPEETGVRACQCRFCRKHGSRAVSDPAGKLTITVHDDAAVQRYRFGLGTADYYLCGRCGIYVAAVMPDGSDLYGIAIVNALEAAGRFTQSPKPADYSAEDEASRRRRRREGWTPATVTSSA
ncbi:MAG: GFA family protein [Kiloniellaceae bacterium]